MRVLAVDAASWEGGVAEPGKQQVGVATAVPEAGSMLSALGMMREKGVAQTVADNGRQLLLSSDVTYKLRLVLFVLGIALKLGYVVAWCTEILKLIHKSL